MSEQPNASDLPPELRDWSVPPVVLDLVKAGRITQEEAATICDASLADMQRLMSLLDEAVSRANSLMALVHSLRTQIDRQRPPWLDFGPELN